MSKKNERAKASRLPKTKARSKINLNPYAILAENKIELSPQETKRFDKLPTDVAVVITQMMGVMKQLGEDFQLYYVLSLFQSEFPEFFEDSEEPEWLVDAWDSISATSTRVPFAKRTRFFTLYANALREMLRASELFIEPLKTELEAHLPKLRLLPKEDGEGVSMLKNNIRLAEEYAEKLRSAQLSEAASNMQETALPLRFEELALHSIWIRRDDESLPVVNRALKEAKLLNDEGKWIANTFDEVGSLVRMLRGLETKEIGLILTGDAFEPLANEFRTNAGNEKLAKVTRSQIENGFKRTSYILPSSVRTVKKNLESYLSSGHTTIGV